MLKDLQKSVEEEEQVWKSKMTNSEEQLKEVSFDFFFSSIYFFEKLPTFLTFSFFARLWRRSAGWRQKTKVSRRFVLSSD